MDICHHCKKFAVYPKGGMFDSFRKKLLHKKFEAKKFGESFEVICIDLTFLSVKSSLCAKFQEFGKILKCSALFANPVKLMHIT